MGILWKVTVNQINMTFDWQLPGILGDNFMPLVKKSILRMLHRFDKIIRFQRLEKEYTCVLDHSTFAWRQKEILLRKRDISEN